MFMYSLAEKIGSSVPIVGSYTRRKQEQEQLNRQHVLQQAVELELSKQHIASAVTILSDAFLDSTKHSTRRRSLSPDSDGVPSSGTITPTAENSAGASRNNSSAGSGADSFGKRTLRSVRSNPLLKLLPSASSSLPSTPTHERSMSSLGGSSTPASAELIPTQNYAFAPTLSSPSSSGSTAVGASLSSSHLADQYIQSVHFLLSALSPTQASQLPDISRRQMRMSLSQAIDRLDLASASLNTEQERSSFWSTRSQVSALDRLLRIGDTRAPGPSSVTPASYAYPTSMASSAPTNTFHGHQQHYVHGSLSSAYPHSPELQAQDPSVSASRGRAAELVTMPAHLALNMASQALSAIILCTHLALGVVIPVIWVMMRMAPTPRFIKASPTQAQGQYEGEAAGGLAGIQQTARSAVNQAIDLAKSPLGMYANAMVAKHAPNVHARASAVWSFAEEQLSANASAWQGHAGNCPNAMVTSPTQQFNPSQGPHTGRSVSSSSSSTLVGSPWPSVGSEGEGDSKYLTWPRQPLSPRLRAISAPSHGPAPPPVQGQSQNGVPFPATAANHHSGSTVTASPCESDLSPSTLQSSPRMPSEVSPVNKRRWSSLIGRNYISSNPSAPTRPPLPENMSVQRAPGGPTHPSRASSVSTSYTARVDTAGSKPTHVRQHSWAPQPSSYTSAVGSAPSSTALARYEQNVPTTSRALTHSQSQLSGPSSSTLTHSSIPPTFPEVLSSLSVQTSRALSDPQSSYSLYNLIPGAPIRRSIRKNVSRSMRQTISWARTNGVLRAGVDAVCVGMEAALAGVEAWGDAEYERQEEGGEPGLVASQEGERPSPTTSTTEQTMAGRAADYNALAVDVPDLNFSFDPNGPLTLLDCNLQLDRGSRCLLIGANGAGKSTLLRIMAGKRLASKSNIRVFGRDVFRDAPRGVTYLGTEWAMNPVVRSDIVVSHFLDSVGGYRHKERRDHLLDILDVDLDWRMHAISDGERRRVQLCMGLMEPWDLLLLDEVTVDLDVQVRADLLNFLTEETIKRKATIIYATHIFDGLQSFPTHVVHMRLGTTVNPKALSWPPNESNAQDYPKSSQQPASADGLIERDLSPLLTVALAWLREDRRIRQEKEKEASSATDAHAISQSRKRGARVGQETTDSETFFSKYDYSAGR
ncbi:hypothetical protein CF326_g2990 [Tilletia indica]|nr:hypothetical protein CF326_g2990 [Tilletia indica]